MSVGSRDVPERVGGGGRRGSTVFDVQFSHLVIGICKDSQRADISGMSEPNAEGTAPVRMITTASTGATTSAEFARAPSCFKHFEREI